MIKRRPAQTEYRLDGKYYCYADPVVGPIVPGVWFNLPGDIMDIHEGAFWHAYPEPRPMPIERVPNVANGGDGCESLSADELARRYADLPGVPYYDTLSLFDEKPGCSKVDLADPHGELALAYGSHHYCCGLDFTEPDERSQRIEHFQLAEILYRHAAGRGNAQGWVNLGYVYSYDRCEGQYFLSVFDHYADDYGLPHRPAIEQLACMCYGKAAEFGHPEGCYKYGDMLAQGKGCERDDAKAFAMFRKAYRLGKHGEPRIWGSAALRLADALVDARGCEQNFAQALRWYRIAVAGLSTAVGDGDIEYERRLSQAEAGEMDMRQELALEHMLDE